jgi:hypothetical protein
LAAAAAKLAEMRAQAVLQEHRFSSTKPIIGPLIIGFRRLWVSIATRWYLLPVFQQQSTVNVHTAELMAGAYQQLAALRQQLTVQSQAPALQRRRLERLLQLLSSDDEALVDAVRSVLASTRERG